MIQAAMLAMCVSGGGVCTSTVCASPVVTYSAPVVKQHVAAVQHQAYVAPVHTQTVYYAVGAHVQLETLIQQKLEQDEAYQAYKQWIAEQTREYIQQKRTAATAPRRRQPSVSEPPARPEPQQVSIAQTCAKCHGSSTPDGGFFLNGEPGMDNASVLASIRAIASGAMPKDAELTKEQKNQLVGELLFQLGDD